MFFNYPKMLCVWNATEFVVLSDGKPPVRHVLALEL